MKVRRVAITEWAWDSMCARIRPETPTDKPRKQFLFKPWIGVTTMKKAILHRKSDTHYIAESTTYGPMVTYNLRPTEHGWSCECEGYAHNYTCYHLKHLYDILGLSPILIPARVAVSTPAPQNKGDQLIALFDYARNDLPPAPTHVVTNRSKVAARPR